MSRIPTHWVAWILVASSIALSAIGQLCMKVGMQVLAGAGMSMPAVVWTGLGLLAYATSMLVWLGVLTRLALSYAYPLLSISYVLVYVGATHWPRIQEAGTPARTIGTLLIAIGVGLVCRSDRRVSTFGTSNPC